jgi:hypothetical protein
MDALPTKQEMVDKVTELAGTINDAAKEMGEKMKEGIQNEITKQFDAIELPKEQVPKLQNELKRKSTQCKFESIPSPFTILLCLR